MNLQSEPHRSYARLDGNYREGLQVVSGFHCCVSQEVNMLSKCMIHMTQNSSRACEFKPCVTLRHSCAGWLNRLPNFIRASIETVICTCGLNCLPCYVIHTPIKLLGIVQVTFQRDLNYLCHLHA